MAITLCPPNSLEARIVVTRSKKSYSNSNSLSTPAFRAEPLTKEQRLKQQYSESGSYDWSRRNFQQFVRALESYGGASSSHLKHLGFGGIVGRRADDYELLASDIQYKEAKEVNRYTI
ncbi:hypothetical protein PAXINDRAFT_16964 [Paxillus involutus ATCC 200175]|uniref:Uncharacterized protein n=1 Tax=Paxillus involutus ATCC 200175 TaxID=664439 RepID=A0A0C9TGR6_PAXIN|nr:hypothetical protein PAXINDRAFT_16964 [Paxillus involutus ATCC 200175]